MDALDEEIAKLNAEIEGYEAEYATASSEARKDSLLQVITAASQNLTELEKQKTAATAGISSWM
jgi:predicted  nucleic acid-binding Zn-ribbon protein